MIKKLQRKITVILDVVLVMILVGALLMLNGYTYYKLERQSHENCISAEKKVRRLFRNNVAADKEDKVIDQIRSFKNVYAVIVNNEG